MIDKKLVVGFITSTHGLQGEVKIKSCSGESSHLLKLKNVEIEKGGFSRNLKIKKIKDSGRKIICKFEGINTIDDAEELTGAEIWTDRKNAAPLKKDEYYFADLCGCSVIYEGNSRGTVLNVCSGGQGELLEIELDGGRTIFIPFLQAFIGEVDIQNKRIEVLKDWFFL